MNQAPAGASCKTQEAPAGAFATCLYVFCYKQDIPPGRGQRIVYDSAAIAQWLLLRTTEKEKCAEEYPFNPSNPLNRGSADAPKTTHTNWALQ